MSSSLNTTRGKSAPGPRALRTGRRRRLLAIVALVTLPIGIVGASTAVAANVALPGSNFEIDEDANLKLDGVAPKIDWATVTEQRQTDKPTGQNDDSYKGGVKEDTSCPEEVTGSIPNNKSDLLTFHFWEEAGVGSHPGFVDIAWSRVSDPSGTTLMDFEFNQSKTKCAVGPNVVRTTGDLLIEYAIDQGGARANITGRTWDGSAWGSPANLSTGTTCGGGPCAVGTINSSSIPDAESDGLGPKAPRTFGEAQIDLRLIFDGTQCKSFGSAMLKSRSSDSFTSQLKDFITPIPIELSNCGSTTVTTPTSGGSPIGSGGVIVGSTVRDSAVITVTGATGQNPTGFVKFFICKLDTGLCDASTPAKTGTQVGTPPEGEALPGDVNPATVLSDGYVVSEVGRYCFRAEYSGDVVAGIPASSDSSATECFNVVSVASSLSTAQSWVPRDEATISAPGGGALAGTVSFALYASSDCAVGGDAAIYSTTRPVAGTSPQTVRTVDAATQPAAQTASGSYSWSVAYTSTNPAQRSIPASCHETSALTITNGGTITGP